MYLKFRQGGEAEKVALAMIQQKDEQYNKAVQIVEDFTGKTVAPGQALGRLYFLDTNYAWSLKAIWFTDNRPVEGFVLDKVEGGYFLFVANKKSKAWKKLSSLLANERFGISSEPLNVFGIYTVDGGLRDEKGGGTSFYDWKLFKKDGFVMMAIHPMCVDMIDWDKAGDQFTVEFKLPSPSQA